MSLMSCTVSGWSGPTAQATWKKKLSSTNSKEMILNTAHMFEVEADGSYAKFKYVNNLYGRRSHGNTMHVLETTASILTGFNVTFENEYLALPIYENEDTSTATVTKYIPAAEVCYAVADERDSTRTWLWYSQGELTVKLLIDYPLADIVYLADEGSTTSSA
jgi:hypothetical protein